MIKPTIGRVVWFWPLGSNPAREDSQPFPALVVFVHSDTLVNLSVFDRNGDLRPSEKVELWQGKGERPFYSHCEWMPYQKGQAAKAEAGIDSAGLEKRIAALEAIVSAAAAANAKSAVATQTATPPVPPPPAK